MNITEEKKNFFYVIILILTLITVIIGAAFAIYTFLHSQTEGSSNVYTGTLSLEYKEGTRIYLKNIYPIYNPGIDATENVYKNVFRIKNTGTLDGILKVSIDIRKNEFEEESLKYKLFSSEGNELTTGNVPKSGTFEVVSNLLLESESTTEFTLIIWLKETGENQNNEMRKSLTGSIKAEANQKID